jgi:hypothetical protein
VLLADVLVQSSGTHPRRQWLSLVEMIGFGSVEE